MIKSGEYIQLLEFFSKPNNTNFIIKYCGLNSIEVIEGCKRLDELRILHNKYKSECENWNVYPNKDLTKLELLKLDLIRVCEEFKIIIEFTELKTIEFKSSIHCNYYFENYKITDLIIFYKKRDNSHVSH